MLNKILKIFTFFFAVALLYNCNVIWYGIQQGRGQLKIVRNAKHLDEFLGDETYPDSLKYKIKLVKEIKQFAFDSLGINFTKNYSKMYNQEGKPGMYVVTACDAFALKSYQWKSPILGSFSYKGYFSKKKAFKEADKLKQKGFDSDVGIVNAWSTLGWFKDPVMSSMLNKTPGQLARVLIHELTHGTLFVKNDIQFNENLASFIGDKGAILFLLDKYGEGSRQVTAFNEELADFKNLRNHLLKGTQELKLFYESCKGDYSQIKKRKKINSILLTMDTLTLSNKNRVSRIIANREKINNTFFTDFLIYREDQKIIEDEFVNKFDADFKKYFTYLKQKYPSL